MSKPTPRTTSALVGAAEALEEELRAIGATAREAQRLPLDSQRNLEATREKLAELGAVDERLGPRIGALMDAVRELVAGQQAQAAALAARAEELRRRRETFQQLMVRYGELGAASRELNALVQAFAGDPRGEGAPAVSERPSLDAVHATMSRVIDDAAAVAAAASSDGFEDVARQAESLRQQLLSARNKLGLLAARHQRAGAVQ